MGVADQGPLRNLFRLATIVAVAAGLATEAVSPSFAQTCGQDYEIKDGETLADIAERTYGSRGQWTVIFYSNQDRLGSNASLLVPGIKLRLPCIGGAGSNASAAQQTPPPVVPEQQPATGSGSIIVSSMTRKLEFLTADGYPPYTGRSLKNGGMITDIIGKAMGLVKEQSNGRVSFNVSWVNDWSAHLNPLLLTRSFDLGFPWSRPPCDNPAELDGESKVSLPALLLLDAVVRSCRLLVRAQTISDPLAQRRRHLRHHPLSACGLLC